MLPIQIPQFAPEQWRSLERQLITIANREKLELEPRDRIVHKALPMIQYAARAKRWDEVFKELHSRGIVQLEKAHAISLQLITAKMMAEILTTKPVDNNLLLVVKRIPKPKYKPSECYTMLSFLRWIADQATEHRLTRMFFCLHYEENGYKKLRTKNKIRIGATAREMLILISPFQRAKLQRNNKKISTSAKKRVLDKAFNSVLTDKWQDIHSIYTKLCQIPDLNLVKEQIDDRLTYRVKIGEIYSHKPEGSKLVYYSKVQATEFDSQWFDFGTAYRLAVEKGCTTAPNTFRTKPHKSDYTKEGVLRYYRKFGLEYRYEVPENENPLFKWRSIN